MFCFVVCMMLKTTTTLKNRRQDLDGFFLNVELTKILSPTIVWHFSTSYRPIPNVMGILYLWMNFDIFLQNVLNLTSTFSNFLIKVQIKLFFTNKKEQSSRKFQTLLNERVVDPLPLMTYGLKLSLKAWILKFKKNHQ